MQAQQIIHNYRLLRFLAQGGMGEVWQAEHIYLHKQIAIKRLHPSLAKDAGTRYRFKHEAATLAHLQHPNIVRLQDYLEDPAEVYLVMEYVEGMPLDDLIQKKTGPIPEPRAADLLRQMLEGVAYAHNQGIIHRDIKPSNFLITPQMEVKILDFGIARVMEGRRGKLTKTGARLGTVLYMSPEQVRGEEADQRSDIYAIGVTLFQMLTGQCPYPYNATEFHVFDQIVNHPLPRANTIYPMVSPHMQALIDKATAKQPELRFQTCEDFLAALTGASPRLAPATPPPPPSPKPQTSAPKPPSPPPPKAKRPRRKAWRALFWVLLILTLLGSGFVGYFFFWQDYVRRHLEPRDVTRRFLEAMERHSFERAKHYADYHCDDYIDIAAILSSQKNDAPRKVFIGKTQEQGMTAQVNYHFEGDTAWSKMDLTWEKRGWMVTCQPL